MKKQFYLVLFFSLLCQPTYTQTSNSLIGARAMSLAYSSAGLQDEWSLFNNVAGLAKINQSTASFSYDARPGLEGFNRMAAVLAVPAKMFTAGIGVYRFGDDRYNEQILSAGIANKLGLASLGLKVNYVQYHSEGFGNSNAFTISFGGVAQLTKVLRIGAHIVNINQPVVNSVTGERMPTVLIAGITVTPSDKFLFATEVEKDLDYDPIIKVGVEYAFHKKFIARTGCNFHPEAWFAGFGWKSKKFALEYALAYNPFFSMAHQATVTYVFVTKK